MNLVLTDQNNTIFYTFPSDFDLHTWDDRDFSARSKVLERFGRHGGSEISDRAIKPRTIRVKGAYHAASQAALRTFLDNLLEHLHHNGEPYRFSWEDGYYINVDLVKNFRQRRLKGGLACKSVELLIEFQCSDPFWYSITQDSHTNHWIWTSPKDWTFECHSNVPSPLKVRLTAYDVCLRDITIENITDEGNLCRYSDPGFCDGDYIEIDARDGSVKKNGSNAIRYFSGAFLRVLPGNNTIRFTNCISSNFSLTAPRRYL